MIQTRAKTGLFYVVADGVDDAYQMVRDDLDNIGYGTIKDREFESATLLADNQCNPDCTSKVYVQQTNRPFCWMTDESKYRLVEQGGNSKGSVPVHKRPSATAKIPLYIRD